MTQPAKAQEPSMEEILASIRRIIADDEAKPAAAAPAPAPAPPPKPAEPVAKAPPPKPAAPPPRAAAPAPKPPEPKPAPAPAPAAKNSQDDIDAMLAGLDAETSVEEVRPAPPAPPPADDVFELTEQMAVAEPFQTIEPKDDIEFAEPPPPPPAREPPPRPAPRAFEERVRERVVEDVAPVLTRPLMSQSTVTAVDSAFNALAQTVLSNNARTLEDLVKEMLRPLLKTWLDDNLPNMVEKIVRAEIERVSRGR